MKLVNQTQAKSVNLLRRSLPTGTVFHYPNSETVFLKTESGHVDLATGLSWKDTDVPDKEVVISEATLAYKDKL